MGMESPDTRREADDSCRALRAGKSHVLTTGSLRLSRGAT
jgi:hypothetical protein